MSAELSVETAPSGGQDLVAPLWHTGIVLAVLLCVTLLGVHTHGQATAGQDRHGGPPLYLSLIFAEWALFYLAYSGMRKRSIRLRDAIGYRLAGPVAFLRGSLITVAFWLVWEGTARVLHLVLGPSDTRNVSSILPRNATEILLWVLLSISAGICEEFVYRGYLQRQVLALTRVPAAAIAIQAAIFGASHAYQGAKQVAIITVLGALYGVLAYWRKSLVPGMAAHAWSDVYGGWLNP